MKYILTQTDGNILGPFDTVQSTTEGYVCDNSLYPTIIYGICTISEVADDYMSPSQIEAYNNNQADLRAQAYPKDSDPIFFQWQRGSKTEQDWLDAVEKLAKVK